MDRYFYIEVVERRCETNRVNLLLEQTASRDCRHSQVCGGALHTCPLEHAGEHIAATTYTPSYFSCFLSLFSIITAIATINWSVLNQKEQVQCTLHQWSI